MLRSKALDICQERYKEGMWVISPGDTEPHYVYGRIVMSDHYYGINHGGWGCLWYKGEFAEIVERPLTSKFYYMDNYNNSFKK